ncbi:MAG: hypothetical protein M5U27_07870 [Gaiella sp.]|nr:hypothetical protein [Gaiella sp.]
MTVLAAAMALSGCGGGGGAEAGDGTLTVDTGSEPTGTRSEPATLDPAAVPAPGEARVEVDGQVHVLRASGSGNFTCVVADDDIRINFQQTAGGDLSFQASVLDGEWLGNVTFAPTGLDNYGGSLSRSGPGLVIGTNAMSYTGTLTYRSPSDPTNTRDVGARIAVNCETSGPDGAGEATAGLDGTTLAFPASGAQSYECEIAPTSVRVLVNRLALEEKQIQIDATQTSGEWLGNVYVISGTDRYNGIIPADGTGLDIIGNALTFTGTFTHTSETDPSVERELSGSASVTCP